MKIIIAGAGDVGFHLAKLLSYESQDTYIIDFDANEKKRKFSVSIRRKKSFFIFFKEQKCEFQPYLWFISIFVF